MEKSCHHFHSTGLPRWLTAPGQVRWRPRTRRDPRRAPPARRRGKRRAVGNGCGSRRRTSLKSWMMRWWSWEEPWWLKEIYQKKGTYKHIINISFHLWWSSGDLYTKQRFISNQLDGEWIGKDGWDLVRMHFWMHYKSRFSFVLKWWFPKIGVPPNHPFYYDFPL